MIRRFWIRQVIYWGAVATTQAQSLTLPQCIEKATAQSASTAQMPFINNALTVQHAIAQTNYLPHLSLNGTASWQSDVTQLPIKLPNLDIKSPAQDQYKLTLDVQQNVWDGRATDAQKNLSVAQWKVEMAKIEGELYGVKEQVTQLYFNIALMAAQVKNVFFLKEQLAVRLKKTIDNQRFGTATMLQVRQLQAKRIELEQQENELSNKKQALLNALSVWIGTTLPIDFQAVIDSTWTSATATESARPELKVFNSQMALTQANQGLLDAKYAPKVALIGTLGYGRPGLNFLATDFQFYGIIGLNVKMPLDQYYTHIDKKESELLSIQNARIQKQIEHFNLQQNVRLQSQKAVIEQLKQAIKLDEQLLNLRISMKQTIENQLDNGIITSADYLDEVNNELLARQNEAVHKVQLAYAQVQYDIILGLF
jgi:outer membrane protein TolC